MGVDLDKLPVGALMYSVVPFTHHRVCSRAGQVVVMFSRGPNDPSPIAVKLESFEGTMHIAEEIFDAAAAAWPERLTEVRAQRARGKG